MSTILGIESTCDETAASVVVDGVDAGSNVVATQAELHAKYRGVVPEIASRAHIENILPVVREATRRGDACVARESAGGPANVGATPASPALSGLKTASGLATVTGDAGVAPTASAAPGDVGVAPTHADRATQASPLHVDAIAVAHRPGLIGS